METFELLIVAVGVFAFSLLSRRAESGLLTGPMVFSIFGLIAGASVLDLVVFRVENAAIKALAEATLVLALFTDASRIDVRRLNANHDAPLRLLGIGLPLSMLAGSAVAFWLFPSLGLWQAAIIGVILAPTDAALGRSVVTNERIPERVRQTLNVESGLNDGLAFPVFLVVLSLALGGGESRSIGEWGVFIAKQLGLGPLVGGVVGMGGAWLVERCASRRWMNRVFLQISVLSLAIIAYSGAELVRGNGFIAAFSAGMAVGTRSQHLLDAIEDFGETEGQLLSLIVFLLFGAVLLSGTYVQLGWGPLLYAILSLTVIRMVPVAISLFGTRFMPVTVVFLGWFGPRGLASILYLLLFLEEGSTLDALSTSTTNTISTTVLLTVALSVAVHGASASPAARAYARRLARQEADQPQPEHKSVFPFPVRFRRHRAKGQPAPRA